MADQELITQKYLQEQQQPEVQEAKKRGDVANSINKIASIFMLVVVVGFGGSWLYMNREAIQETTSRENVARSSANWMIKASGRDVTVSDIQKNMRAKGRKRQRDLQRKMERQFK